ncbi:GvpL/GvpF family gas vesicle protein [Myxococcus sp. K38C18041901]|uniref:GvpL/GvpF family gas vesicle protein n=1 Tax=Myxococcus guangdongensis TaxID=2906760 RepID=UPI0020A70799|nr:GvpL/GvpF family gas vesicle protein [Myxococcus guangdongensis]MCP3064123.1 GvpL/GvpF family gas vesicle protein [Myxococcus guangdongensis]
MARSPRPPKSSSRRGAASPKPSRVRRATPKAEAKRPDASTSRAAPPRTSVLPDTVARGGKVARPLPDAPTDEERAGPQYLYGVVRADGPLDFGPIGLGIPPSHVRAVCEHGLAALVSPTPSMRVDPTRAHLLAHQRAAEVVLREHTLLPVAFGTVLGSEAHVRALLHSTHESLRVVLTALEGKVELGLKVLYHREHLNRRMELEDEELRRRADESELEHEQRLGRAVELRAALDMAAMLEGLRPLAAASRTDAPVGERMLLNAAFLVARQDGPAFEAKVRMLAARSDLYTFRFTGPWAPYSFVDVRLGRVDDQEPRVSRTAG